MIERPSFPAQLVFVMAIGSVSLPFCSAADRPERIAVGPWSEEVDGLSGRLVLVQGETLGEGQLQETVAYLELRNKRPKGARSIYFDPRLKCELREPDGKVVPQKGQGYGGGAGGRPEPEWLKLPFDSRIRLRLSPFGLGTDDGLRLNIGGDEWNIKSADKGEYSLSGRFTSDPPVDAGGEKSWNGTLELPALKLKAAIPPLGGR